MMMTICHFDMRNCSRCNIQKPLKEFFKDKYKPHGYTYTCKKCLGVKTYNKNCKTCNKEFTTNRSLQKYCSHKCSPKSHKNYKPKTCKNCKTEFTPVSSLNKFCNRKCEYEFNKNSKSKKPKTKVCLSCNSVFKPYTSLDKFCSIKCRVDHKKSKRLWSWKQKDVEKIEGKNNPAYRNGFYCKTTKRTADGNRKFLRNSNSLKENMINEKGYLYCENCNKSSSLKFETHHIIYRSEKPFHNNLHDKINLIVLCIRCHNDFHKEKNKRDGLVKQRNLTKYFGTDILNKKI